MRYRSPLHYAITIVALATVGGVAYLLMTVPPDLLPFDKLFAAVFGDALICLGMFRSARKLRAKGAEYDGRMWPSACLAFFAVLVLGSVVGLQLYRYLESLDEVPRRGVPLTLGQPMLIQLIWFSLSLWIGARILYLRPRPVAFLNQLRRVAGYSPSTGTHPRST